MNTEMNSNMEMNGNIPTVKRNNKNLIFIPIVIVALIIGVLIGKFLIPGNDTNTINSNKNTQNNNTNTVVEEDSNDSETVVTSEERYSEYLEQLASEYTSKYTDYTYPKMVVYSEMIGFSYVVRITKDNVLFLNNEKVADNVLTMFVAINGNGGYKGLYYINKEGKLFVAAIEEHIYNKGSDLDITSLNYKNIVNVSSAIKSPDGMAGTYSPIFIDIDGNTFIGE